MTSSAPVRVGLLGCGGIQAKHARTFLTRPDARIAALCDVSDAAIDKLVERLESPAKLKDVPRFTGPVAMYDGAELDAVSIATPHTLHFEQAMEALGRGLHVLLEKPMVTQADHAHTLAAEVGRSGKVLIVAYNTPCSPELAYIRELIRTQELGKLELVTGWLSQGWMKGTAGKWRQDPALSGGGEAYDSGAHLFNTLCWLIEAPVSEVFAWCDNHGTPVDINSVMNIKFENNVMASITVAGNCPGQHCFMALMFEHGHVEFDPCGWGDPWINIWGPDKKRIKYPRIEGEQQSPDDNFIDAILGKDEPRTTRQNGIVQTELMDAIYESARTGQVARPVKR